MINGFNAESLQHLEPATKAAIVKRTRLLGPAYRLFYQKPLDVCRGKGAFLYDRNGTEYLDAYNNVASVGHSHPRIADAVYSQLNTLCTHTRYIQAGILDYAQDLLSHFDGRIGQAGHVMFTCTGSEANDLAMRIAQHHTGHGGIIITRHAYHGNSSLTSSFSPSLGAQSRLGPWVRQIDVPDSYRIPAESMATWFVEQVARQIADLERRGNGLAAFIFDPLFTSDGIYSSPVGAMAQVAELVRKAGGLLVADEVQSGFARTGAAFWGYQLGGLDPDIVTMGKPMGNGFPVAGLAIVPEVVSRFGSEIRYFNTFGGNTVAIAAAQTTLDIIRDEGLQANAVTVGAALQNGIKSLAEKHDCIGDVRGAGLYIGVEMVLDRASKERASSIADAVVNGLRERGVLISATGDYGNCLKIRPPLMFSQAHVDRLLSTLDATLSAL